MALHRTLPPDDGFRREGDQLVVVRRDFVPPVPEGSYVVMVFRVTGYDPDSDGAALARVARVGLDGQPTGWEESGVDVGLGHEDILTVDHPSDLLGMAQG